MDEKKPSLSRQADQEKRVEDLKRSWEAGMSTEVSVFQRMETDAAKGLAAKGFGPLSGTLNRAYGDIARKQVEFASNLFEELVQKSGVEIKSDEALKKILQVGMEIMEPCFKGMEARAAGRLAAAGYGPTRGTGNHAYGDITGLKSEYHKQLNAKLLKVQLASRGPENGAGDARWRKVASIIIALFVSIIFEVAVNSFLRWDWLLRHPHSYGLQGCFCLTASFGIVGLWIRPWRKALWGTGIFGVILVVLAILGGPTK